LFHALFKFGASIYTMCSIVETHSQPTPRNHIQLYKQPQDF